LLEAARLISKASVGSITYRLARAFEFPAIAGGGELGLDPMWVDVNGVLLLEVSF